MNFRSFVMIISLLSLPLAHAEQPQKAYPTHQKKVVHKKPTLRERLEYVAIFLGISIVIGACLECVGISALGTMSCPAGLEQYLFCHDDEEPIKPHRKKTKK